MKTNRAGSRIFLIASMAIFGTIGIFRRALPFPSGFLAMARGLIGSAFLLFLSLFGKRISFRRILSRLPLLALSGALIGFNWILLFEAYRYTTVSTATLCYYTAPIFVVLASPLLLRERLGMQKLCAVALSFLGVFFVSGILSRGAFEGTELLGIAYGLGAAMLYASIIVLNRKFTDIDIGERTVAQLFFASAVLIPYTLIFEDIQASDFTAVNIGLVLLLGILHTGIAYTFYFASMRGLSAPTVAILGYMDPAVAIILSVAVLGEPLTLGTVIGTVLILGGALLSELDFGKLRHGHPKNNG